MTSFDTFWFSYPKKIGKAKAEAAFKRHCKGVDIAEIIKAIKLQRQLRQWSQRQYIPHPATWINQHRWEDEYEARDFAVDRERFDEFGWEL